MDTVEQVTGRQLEVARLVAEGRSNPEIAEALGVSLAGAKYHVSELLGRLGVSSREEIAEWYRGHGQSVQPRPQWRQRLRGLLPFGVLLGSGAAAAMVLIALSGGRDDSALPTATAEPSPVAIATKPSATNSRGIADPGGAPQMIDYCTLGPWEEGRWPARDGLLQPSYFPDGWRPYSIAGGAADWNDPDSDCIFPQLQITLAPVDTPPPNEGPIGHPWIAFTQTPLDGPAPDLTTDEPVDLGAGRTAYRSVEDGAERLAWQQDGIIALLVSPSIPASELVRIAESTRLADTSPKIPLFWEYEVQPSDTPEEIADRFGVSVETVIFNNVDMTPTGEANSFVQVLEPGTIAIVPTVDGILHTVSDGDTVAGIAELYDADERDILEFRANGLESGADNLEPGSLILVPGGTKFAPTAAPAADATGWAWPVEGELKTPFGPEHPVGIDIRVPLETEVRAALAGEVTFAGGDPCCDLGYHVIIEHADGFETLYAHLGGFGVVEGASVDAGNAIGTVGMTGETDEPHLHFEIRRAGAYEDPLNFLP